jgi:hypothetical protein
MATNKYIAIVAELKYFGTTVKISFIFRKKLRAD